MSPELAQQPTARMLHPTLLYQTDLAREPITPERALVLERLSDRPRVLEIGAASGFFTRELLTRGHEVTAYEADPRAVERAQVAGLPVRLGDAEDLSLWRGLEGQFDAVLFMHVLEHLVDPWAVLRAAGRALVRGGTVVALLPNVGAWRIRKDLFLGGRFEYEDTGILDRTHLRFFTLPSGVRLLEDAGFQRVAATPTDICVPFERRLRIQLRAHRLAAWWTRFCVARFPNLCTEIFLVTGDAPGS